MTSAKATLSAATAAILWGSIGIVTRLAEQHGGDIDMLIIGRALGGALLSLPLLAHYRAKPTLWSLAIALLGLAPLYYTYMKAVGIVGAAVASILLYTAPLWVAVLGIPLLGEKPGLHGIASIALGIAGAALVSGAVGGTMSRLDPKGVAYGLASGLTYALYIILARLAQKKGATIPEASLAPIAITGIILLAALHPTRQPNNIELAASAYLAAFTIILPYMLHVYALKHIEAHRVSIISLLEPLSAVTLAHAILGERLNARQLAGATLILTATITANIEQHNNNTTNNNPEQHNQHTV